MSKIPMGVLGATGAVGQRLVRLMNGHPWFEIAAIAGSERTTGKRYGDTLRPVPAGTGPVAEEVLDMKLSASEPRAFAECRVVFSALPAEAARDLEPEMARAGLGVISNASSHRMGQDVPLIV